MKINEFTDPNSINQNRSFEIVLNGKVVGKDFSYCTMIDKSFGNINGKELVLISQRIRDGGALAYSKNNPIGSDTKYKLLTLMSDGSYLLSNSFGNGSPYVQANPEGGKIVMKFQDYYLLDDPNRYIIGSEETWIYQNGKLSRIPKRQR